jgi:hypothetical protein
MALKGIYEERRVVIALVIFPRESEEAGIIAFIEADQLLGASELFLS